MNFNDKYAENDFIDDNGDHEFAKYDRDGLASYANRGTASPRFKPAKPSDAKKAAATEARNSIKDLGYRALKTGTPKQKAWAEKIRKEVVEKLPAEIRGHLVHLTDAKFWIDNRDNSVAFWKSQSKEPAKTPTTKDVARRAKTIIDKNTELRRVKNRAPQWTQPGREDQAAAFEHLKGQELEAFLVEFMTVHARKQGPELHESRAAMKSRFNIAEDARI